MEILLALLPIAVILGGFLLLVITLRDAMKLKGSELVAWLCLIVFLFPLGSIIFLIVNPGHKE